MDFIKCLSNFKESKLMYYNIIIFYLKSFKKWDFGLGIEMKWKTGKKLENILGIKCKSYLC